MRHTRRHEPAPDPAPGPGGDPARATRGTGADSGDRQGWLDEAAAEVLLDGGVVVPADAWDAVNAARLAQLLAAAASVTVRRPPGAALREDAAVMAFRAARVSAPGRTLRTAVPEEAPPAAASRGFFRWSRAARPSGGPRPSRVRALRVSAAAAVSVLAVGGMAVAVAGGRYVLPGDGAGSGPVSRPPAAVAPDGATAGPATTPPVTRGVPQPPRTPAPQSPSASPTPSAPADPSDASHPAEAAPKAPRTPVPALPATSCGAQHKDASASCHRQSHHRHHGGHRRHDPTPAPTHGKHAKSGPRGGR